jgi:drug/metabolite transporter (DMT)-like permease
MRKMKSAHWMTLNLYLNILFIVVTSIILTFEGWSNLGYVNKFGVKDWILIFLTSVTEISCKSFRLMALRYEKPGKLAPYQYSKSVFMLSYDLFIFHAVFT